MKMVDVFSALKEDGARGLVNLNYANGVGSHVVNIINKNGVIWLLNGQIWPEACAMGRAEFNYLGTMFSEIVHFAQTK